jgi:creatinine amidohydrolase
MRVRDCHWMQIEALLQSGEDRAVLPLGSVEQHAYLSLATDAVLAEQVAIEAAEPLGVPVFPVVAYGVTPLYMAYPGTMTLQVETLRAVLTDLIESLHHHGFRRLLIVNGHGGNKPLVPMLKDDLATRLPELQLRWHHWWAAPRTMAFVREQDPQASHASWMENFPGLTRVTGASPPTGAKPAIDTSTLSRMTPAAAREYLGDGCYGGRYEMPDAVMQRLWALGVVETREAITHGWSETRK